MLDTTKKVWVYFNLHKKLFSVKQKNKVIDHTRSIILKDVEYVVWEGGRQRVLREKKKNVHAFVKGYVVDSIVETYSEKEILPVIYNPYNYNVFVTDKEQVKSTTPVLKSEYAVLKAPEGSKPSVAAHGAYGTGFPVDKDATPLRLLRDDIRGVWFEGKTASNPFDPNWKTGGGLLGNTEEFQSDYKIGY